MGNRQENLETALDLLRQRVNVILVSPTYDTEPVGNPDQPRFLNLACQIKTRLSPLELLTLTNGIESKLGRVSGPPDSPRPIDIDILFYGEEVIETTRLTIPHPRLQERGFVLVPLADIAPDLVHPVSGKSIRELLAALQKGVQGVFPWPGK
jgi:2-amino-4-hydroxy-6-hydroxymethyldihydropteridine diphosphokinase